MAANSGATGASSVTASAIMYTVPAAARNWPMSNPSPGPGSTETARAGSAMNDSARDMTIRTVAAVFCASDRSSARVIAHWAAPAAARMSSARAGVSTGHPAGHRPQVGAGQRGGVEVGPQVIRGLGGPERAILDPFLRNGVRERVRPADRGRLVLAASQPVTSGTSMAPRRSAAG